MPYAEGERQVGQSLPGVLNVVLKFVREIVPGNGRPRSQCIARLTISVYLKVELPLGKGHQAGNDTGCDVVAGLVPAVDSGVAKSIGVETTPGAGNSAAGIQPLIVGAGETVRGRVRILVVGDNAQIDAVSQRVVFVRPCHVVNEVVDRHVDDGGAIFGSRLGHISQLDVSAAILPSFAIALAYVAIAKVVNEIVGDGPGIACRDALAVVFREIRRGLPR